MINDDGFKDLGAVVQNNNPADDDNFKDLGAEIQPSTLDKAKSFAGGAINTVIPSSSATQGMADFVRTLPGMQNYSTASEYLDKNPIGDPNSGWATAGKVAVIAPAVIGGGAALGKLGLSALKYSPQALKYVGNLAEKIPGVSNAIDALTSRGADNIATDVNNSLLHGETLSTAHQPIVDNIRTNGQGQLARVGGRYNNFLDEALNRGYLADDVGAQYKVINTPQFNSNADNITQLDPEIKAAYQTYTDNPNVLNAHNFQSTLGDRGAKFMTSSARSDRDDGRQILAARRGFIGEMKSSLADNGDSDLANTYGDISNDYQSNVLPYLKTNTVRNIVTGKDLNEINPINIHNILKQDKGDINYITGQLSPQSNDLILAKAMAARGGNGSIPANSLLSKFQGLDASGFGKFIEPRHEDAIQNILSQQKQTSNAQWATGAGGALASLYAGHRYLF